MVQAIASLRKCLERMVDYVVQIEKFDKWRKKCMKYSCWQVKNGSKFQNWIMLTINFNLLLFCKTILAKFRDFHFWSTQPSYLWTIFLIVIFVTSIISLQIFHCLDEVGLGERTVNKHLPVAMKVHQV